MKVLTCEQCGNSFENIRNRRFCSHKCSNQWKWDNVREKAVQVITRCMMCGENFSINIGEYNRRINSGNVPKFCNIKCYSDYCKKHKKPKESQAKEKTEKVCYKCGVKFMAVIAKDCPSCRGKYARSKVISRSKYTEIERILIKKLKGMNARCEYEKNNSYKNYGAKGISVYKEWVNTPSLFITWALDNGYKKGLHIDRIDDKGSYSPDNCQFLTQKQNNRKKQGTVRYVYKGELLSLGEIAEIENVKYKTLWQFVKRNC